MSFRSIYLYLAQDVPSLVTTSATSVQALNTDLWASPSFVPPYAYKSLGQILISSTCSSSELAKHIVYKDGEALENSDTEITLLGGAFESAELPRDGFFSDALGAETMKMDIVVRLPDTAASFERATNADLRLRYLLDHKWRGHRRRTNPYIPNMGDATINGDVFCQFLYHPYPPNAKEVVSRWVICYTRAVPR